MATYNFGMLTAGMPDPTMRQASTGIQDAGYYQGLYDDFLKGWQSRYDAAAPTPIYGAGTPASGPSFGDVLQSWGYHMGQPDAPWDAAIAEAARLGGTSGSAGGIVGYDDSARQALNAEKARQDATLGAQASGFAANQQAQQQAYNASGGGTFLGGNINSSYATPPTGLDPNSSLNGMLTQQPWSMPGFGGPTGGTSQSGFGANTGNAWGATQPQGWGGPFSAKNPWAAS